MSTSVDASYDRCVNVTRMRARNFYFGIRLLPVDRRRALCAVYALARRIDDIGDGSLPRAEKVAALQVIRQDVGQLASGRQFSDPVLTALHDASLRFPLPVDAFADLIDGVEMDLHGVEYEEFQDLVVYCRRVAGSIGRLCLGVLETSDRRRAEPLADDLGVALQLTNILRDVVEDLRMGRVYLPTSDIDRFALDRNLRGPDPELAELLRYEAERAAWWYDRGQRLLPLLDRRGAACVGTMSGIYRALLGRIQRRPDEVLEGRVALSAWRKGWLAARHLAGATP